MNARRCLRTLVLSVFPLALALAASVTSLAACGTDVASCGTVCPAGSSCAAECASLTTSCMGSQAESSLQLLLTCVGNANGKLSPLPTLCQDEMNAVQTTCTGRVAVDAH